MIYLQQKIKTDLDVPYEGTNYLAFQIWVWFCNYWKVYIKFFGFGLSHINRQSLATSNDAHCLPHSATHPDHWLNQSLLALLSLMMSSTTSFLRLTNPTFTIILSALASKGSQTCSWPSVCHSIPQRLRSSTECSFKA